jgi:hypothetical protein
MEVSYITKLTEKMLRNSYVRLRIDLILNRKLGLVVEIPESLVEQSELTPIQIEAIASYVGIRAGQLKWKDAATSMRRKRKQSSDKPITLGSYYRTVQQGKDNVKKSAVTLLIAVWLGLVRVEDMRRLFELASRNLADLSEEDRSRFGAVLQALLAQMTS